MLTFVENSNKKVMLKTISLDSKTIVIKANKEDELSDVIDYIAQKTKHDNLSSFLNFASKHRASEAEYKFNREDCYDRQDFC
jgi:hypothetical protein